MSKTFIKENFNFLTLHKQEKEYVCKIAVFKMILISVKYGERLVVLLTWEGFCSEAQHVIHGDMHMHVNPYLYCSIPSAFASYDYSTDSQSISLLNFT